MLYLGKWGRTKEGYGGSSSAVQCLNVYQKPLIYTDSTDHTDQSFTQTKSVHIRQISEIRGPARDVPLLTIPVVSNNLEVEETILDDLSRANIVNDLVARAVG